MKDVAYWEAQFKGLTPLELSDLKKAIAESEIFVQECRQLNDALSDLDEMADKLSEEDVDADYYEACIGTIEGFVTSALLTLDRG